MKPDHRFLSYSFVAIALGVSLWGCEDDASDTTVDAAMASGDGAVLDTGTPVVNSSTDDAAVPGDSLTAANPDAEASPAEFTWHIDPTEVQLQRGTCRTVWVHVERRNGYNGPITIGVGDGPAKVSLGTNHIAAGESSGAFALVTAANAPAVNAKPMLIAATGDKTHLRLTILVTVADTQPVTDGGVVEPAGVDGSVFDEATCRSLSAALDK